MALAAIDGVSSGSPVGAVAHDLGITVAKSPLAADWRITIEGHSYLPGQFKYNGTVWALALPQFPVGGTLDIILEGRGVDNGTQRGRVVARIACDGTTLTPDLDVLTIKGYGVDQRSYVV